MREPGHERLIGRTIAGKFVVEELLGAGAMGAVYRARQSALEKTVAIKVLHGDLAHDATFAARFHREAKAASRLNHPNSMQVVDFGTEPDGLLYIAMEYLDGRSLHHVLREEWPLASARIADILMQALAALAVAHDMGVVHRDLKPENVMVLRGTDDDGRPKDLVKVCDFGIAKITDSRSYRGERESSAPVTSAGFLVGTPEYMSPEQGRGERLDARSDLYSIGVVLFEMLTRRVPFEAENAIGVVLRHITEAPLRPSDLAPSVDLRLEAVCLRALRKAPSERYASAREMRADLRAVALEGAAATAPEAGASAPALAVGGAPLARTVDTQPTVHARPFPDEGAQKPTLLGTATTIPGSPARRALVVASAALVSGALAAASVVMLARPHLRAPQAAPSAITTDLARTTPAAPPIAHPTDVDSTRPDPSPSSVPHAAVTHGRTSLPPAAKPAPAAIGPPAASVSVALVPLPIQSAPPALGTSTGPPPARTPPGPIQPAEPDPTFDPEHAYVEVGLVNAQGAREPAVRAAMRNLGLARCYRGALRARGGRATGTATLNLSFDESGFARSAIVTGADFLPGLARCLQGASAGARIPRAAVDPAGATAEVILAFKAP